VTTSDSGVPRQHFDSIVVGAGPAGEVAAGELAAGGQKVAVVEKERVAGECSFWACMPSKTLLRPSELLTAARRAPGAAEAVTGRLDVRAALAWRDRMVSNWDDSGYATWLTDRGIEIFRGNARLVGDGAVDVENHRLVADNIVLATGSVPSIPPIEGLSETRFWTNREATGVQEVPERLLILGGGAVGVELSQAFARFGASVALIEGADRILPGEDPRVAAGITPALKADGVEVHVGVTAKRIHGGEHEQRVELSDGTELRGNELLVATGRHPASEGLGLESLPVKLERGAVQVDSRLRAAPGVYAIGDVNGIHLTTHTGKYQARVAAAEILGHGYDADYRAIPRVVYTDPNAVGVGLTPEAAEKAGFRIAQGTGSVADTAASSIVRADWRDAFDEFLTLVADATTGKIIGAFAVGPHAADWMGQATLAVQTSASAEALARTIQPFPALSEVFTLAARDLVANL
jgi:pyruvate/2-oxoglutarate dehydrogenase complex dihydrolipoamide dehydrogenase (E3) component